MRGADDLQQLSAYVFARTRARLDGLTDDELRWEPAPLCWSVRRRADGAVRADWASWPDAGPVTTIAWRLWHLTVCYGQARNELLLRGTADDEGDRCEPHLDAAGALAALDAAHEWWRDLLASFDDDALAQPMGPVAGPYAEQSRASFVLHMLDEHIHHGAELALLRDLYAATVAAPADPVLVSLARGGRPADLERLRAERPDLVRWAAVNGHWRAVPVLVDAGFDLDATAAGATALHHAASAGELDVVRLLVEHGADRRLKDDVFRSTPVGWAAHFGHDEVVAYLRSLRTPGEAEVGEDG